MPPSRGRRPPGSQDAGVLSAGAAAVSSRGEGAPTRVRGRVAWAWGRAGPAWDAGPQLPGARRRHAAVPRGAAGADRAGCWPGSVAQGSGPGGGIFCRLSVLVVGGARTSLRRRTRDQPVARAVPGRVPPPRGSSELRPQTPLPREPVRAGPDRARPPRCAPGAGLGWRPGRGRFPPQARHCFLETRLGRGTPRRSPRAHGGRRKRGDTERASAPRAPPCVGRNACPGSPRLHDTRTRMIFHEHRRGATLITFFIAWPFPSRFRRLPPPPWASCPLSPSPGGPAGGRATTSLHGQTALCPRLRICYLSSVRPSVRPSTPHPL